MHLVIFLLACFIFCKAYFVHPVYAIFSLCLVSCVFVVSFFNIKKRDCITISCSGFCVLVGFFLSKLDFNDNIFDMIIMLLKRVKVKLKSYNFFRSIYFLNNVVETFHKIFKR